MSQFINVLEYSRHIFYLGGEEILTVFVES